MFADDDGDDENNNNRTNNNTMNQTFLNEIEGSRNGMNPFDGLENMYGDAVVPRVQCKKVSRLSRNSKSKKINRIELGFMSKGRHTLLLPNVLRTQKTTTLFIEALLSFF